jgi:hypothetical protein
MSRFSHHIPQPCDQDVSKMPGDEKRKFCSVCDKHVYNISALTKPQAEQLMRRPGGPPCVSFLAQPSSGEPTFRPTRRKLLATAALGAAGLMLAPTARAAGAFQTPDDDSIATRARRWWSNLWNSEPEGCEKPSEMAQGNDQIMVAGGPMKREPTPPPVGLPMLDDVVPVPPIRPRAGKPKVRQPPKPTAGAPISR